MAYDNATPTVKELQPDGRVRVVYVFTGLGETAVSREILVSDSTTAVLIKDQLVSTLSGLNRIKAVAAGIIVNTPADVIVVVTPPTQAEKDKAAFLVAQATLRDLQRSVAGGLIPANDPTVLAADAAYKAAFKPEYGGLVTPVP